MITAVFFVHSVGGRVLQLLHSYISNEYRRKVWKYYRQKNKELELFFNKTPFEHDLSSRGNDDRIPGECLIVHCIIVWIHFIYAIMQFAMLISLACYWVKQICTLISYVSIFVSVRDVARQVCTVCIHSLLDFAVGLISLEREQIFIMLINVAIWSVMLHWSLQWVTNQCSFVINWGRFVCMY